MSASLDACRPDHMPSVFLAELAKLRRTPILWLAIALPILYALIGFAQVVDSPRPEPLRLWLPRLCGFWAALMLPFIVAMTCGAISAAEHRNDTWRYLLALPRRRSSIYISKLLAAALVVGVAMLAYALSSLAAAEALSQLVPQMVDSPFSSIAADNIRNAAFVYLASLAQISLVSWLSTRVQWSTAPIMAAIAGVGIALPFWSRGRMFLVNPWQFTPGVVAHDASHPVATTLLIAAAVTLVAAIAGAADFTRPRATP